MGYWHHNLKEQSQQDSATTDSCLYRHQSTNADSSCLRRDQRMNWCVRCYAHGFSSQYQTTNTQGLPSRHLQSNSYIYNINAHQTNIMVILITHSHPSGSKTPEAQKVRPMKESFSFFKKILKNKFSKKIMKFTHIY